MVVEVNLNSLYTAKLSPNQYIILKLLWEKNTDECKVLFDTVNWKEDITRLMELGYILKFDASNYILDKTKAAELLGFKDTYFWEFYSTYPIHVIGTGGKRVLRTASCDSAMAKECMKKYLKKVTTRAKHEHVMACLNLELSLRRKGKSLGYMQLLTTYLNKNGWESYEHMLTEVSVTETKKYGQDLI